MKINSFGLRDSIYAALGLYIKNIIVLVGITLISLKTMASSGEAHHGGIPWGLITAQTVNFTLFLGLLIYILRKPAADYFKDFRNKFLDESSKAEKVAADAERHKKEIEDQLKKLETTYATKLESSKKEAQSIRQNMVNDAMERSKKLILDTTDNTTILFKSAQESIKNQVLDTAISSAKVELAKKIDIKESERLQDEFLEEIKAGYL